MKVDKNSKIFNSIDYLDCDLDAELYYLDDQLRTNLFRKLRDILVNNLRDDVSYDIGDILSNELNERK